MTLHYDDKMRYKNRLWNILSIFCAQTIGFAINFFLSPYLAENVNTTAYGFITLANNFTNYAALVTVALNSMATRFIVVELHQGNQKKADMYFSSTLFANFILAAIFLVLSVGVVLNLEKLLNIPQEFLADIKLLFSLIFLSFIVSTATSIFSVCYYATGRLYYQNICVMESAFLRLVVILLLFAFCPSRIFYIGAAGAIVALFLMVCNLYYSRRLLESMRFKRSSVSWASVKELLSSGVWNTVNSLGTTLSEGLDLLISNLFIDAYTMTVLAIAKTIPTALSSIMVNIGGMFIPEAMHDYAKGDKKQLEKSLLSSMRIMKCVINTPYACFIGFGLPFFLLWQPLYDGRQLYALAILSLLATTFTTCISPIYNVFMATNNLRFPAICHVIGGAVSTTLVFLLLNITDWGVFVIAGVSSVIGIIKTLFFILPYAAKLVDISYKKILLASLSSAASIWIFATIGLIFAHYVLVDSWTKFFVYGTAYVLVILVLDIMISLNKSEREGLLKRVLKR
jgi:O-antigen/teichoic acid export membrane protein